MSDELQACVECGDEVPKRDMFGALGDRRCEPCAKGIRKRMAPKRVHAVARASTGDRRARRKRRTIAAGVGLVVLGVIAWAIPGRDTAVRVDSGAVGGSPVGGEQRPNEQAVFLWRYHPLSTPGEGPQVDPDALAAALPQGLPGWKRKEMGRGRGDPGEVQVSWARLTLTKGDDQLMIFVADGGRPTDEHLRAFRSAANDTFEGQPAVNAVPKDAPRGIWLRVLLAKRFWVEVTTTHRDDAEAALKAVDRAKLEALAKG